MTEVNRYSVVLHMVNDSPFRQTGDSCTRPKRTDVVLAADYAALEAECERLRRDLDRANEFANTAVLARDAMAAELAVSMDDFAFLKTEK